MRLDCSHGALKQPATPNWVVTSIRCARRPVLDLVSHLWPQTSERTPYKVNEADKCTNNRGDLIGLRLGKEM